MNDKNRKMFFDEDEEMAATFTLTDEEGNDVEAVMIASYELAQEDDDETKEFAVLLPVDDEGEPAGDVVFFRYVEIDGEPDFQDIEDPDEYQLAVQSFKQMVDNGELGDIECDFEDDDEDDGEEYTNAGYLDDIGRIIPGVSIDLGDSDPK